MGVSYIFFNLNKIQIQQRRESLKMFGNNIFLIDKYINEEYIKEMMKDCRETYFLKLSWLFSTIEKCEFGDFEKFKFNISKTIHKENWKLDFESNYFKSFQLKIKENEILKENTLEI